jgi:geranylgeranyl diphosphate synthase type II
MNFEHHIQSIEKSLAKWEIPQESKNLVEPIRYLLSLGGKRIRPVLTLLGHELFNGNAENVISQALAVEVFHNFTLMHDDIMDNAPLRRGKQTVHEKWNVNTAVLSGDGMMIQSYDLLLKNQEDKFVELFRCFNQTAWEVCVGQQMDMDFEKREDVSLDEYLEMIRLKTAVLLGCALRLGAIAANASAEDQEHLRLFGEHLGLSFQLRDDYLDAYGDPEKFGKQVGGDILSDKKTYLYLHTANHEDESIPAELKSLHGNSDDPQAKITSTLHLFSKSKADEVTLSKSEAYYTSALDHLNAIAVPEEKKLALRKLASYLLERES